MRIFLAGGTGVLGTRLIPRLAAAGHEISATTRRAERAERLSLLGARPAVIDVYDAEGLIDAVQQARRQPDRSGRTSRRPTHPRTEHRLDLPRGRDARHRTGTAWIPVFAEKLGAPAPAIEPLPEGRTVGRAVSNAKARSRGWKPEFPSWRDGFAPSARPRDGR